MILDRDGAPTRPSIRVAVSLPAGDSVATGFAYDLARMMTATAAQRADIELRLHVVRSTILPEARAELVAFALNADCTHVLFVDSDMRFPKDALVRLLAHREPVVGVNYARRRHPITPTAMDEDFQPIYVEPGVDGLVPVAFMGLGLALIDLDVFRQVPGPWFQVGFASTTGKYVGEDVYFSALVREHGLVPLVDNTLSREVAHLGEMEYRSEHALQLRELAAPDEAPVSGDA